MSREKISLHDIANVSGGTLQASDFEAGQIYQHRHFKQNPTQIIIHGPGSTPDKIKGVIRRIVSSRGMTFAKDSSVQDISIAMIEAEYERI